MSRWWIAAAMVLLPSVVMATAVIAETLEEMTQNAPVIVRGRVGQIQAQLDEHDRRIYTYADVQVSEVLKGPNTSSVLIKVPGGVVGGRGMGVAGAPRFVSDQQTVLFLEPAADEKGVWIVRALAGGKVDLETSAKGEVRAVRHLEGLAFFEKSGSVRVFHPEDDLGPAGTFLTRVRTTVKAGSR